MINVIAPALDAPEQPDYKRLSKLKTASKRLQVYQQMLEWKKICRIVEIDGFFSGLSIIHIADSELWALYISPTFFSRWVWKLLFHDSIEILKKSDKEKLVLRAAKWNIRWRWFYEHMWCILTDDFKVTKCNWEEIEQVKYVCKF